MLFNSYIFIFLFLPLALVGWYGLNRIKKYRLAQVFLVGMSLWFYAYFHVEYLAIILCSCAVNYLLSLYVEKCCSVQMEKAPQDGKGAAKCSARRKGVLWLGVFLNRRKAVLWLGCILNLGILGYYKYFDFLLENVNGIAGTDFNLHHILLPLGISFFTFQQLSFVVDRCKGQAPHYDLVDYLTFVTFFPQLIAGPIVLHSQILPQFQNLEKRGFDSERFGEGIYFFVIGLAKKVLLADLLAKPVAFAFDNYSGLDSLTLLMGAVAYMLELYFDFSGYCDMAVGIGKMFGIELPVNFDSPYKSASVREFWRRWHITLGRFFTTYVYIPLGGSRKGKLRLAVNTIIVFALSGLWHGANWTFVIWGILHGICVVWDRVKPDFMNREKGIWKIGGVFFTNLFVCLAWILFRSNSIEAAEGYIKGLFSMQFFHSLGTLAGTLETSELYVVKKALSLTRPELIGSLYLGVFLAVMALCLFLMTRKNTVEMVKKSRWGTGTAAKLALLFAWSVISLSGVSTFLYFNF